MGVNRKVVGERQTDARKCHYMRADANVVFEVAFARHIERFLACHSSSVANFDSIAGGASAPRIACLPTHAFKSTALPDRTAARTVAIDLSRRLRLRGRALSLLPLAVSRLGVLAGRNRLLVLHLLALVIVVDAIARAAGDLHAGISIFPEAGVADQRAYATLLALDRVERVDVRQLGVKLRPGMLVEQRQRAL